MPVRGGDEAGFSLLEVCIVVAVVGVLMALAYPTFRGAAVRAGDRRAQEDLRSGLVVARITSGEPSGRFEMEVEGVVEPLVASTLMTRERGVVFTDDPSAVRAGRLGVKVHGPGNSRVHLWTTGEPGAWWGIVSSARGTVTFCHGDEPAAVTDIDTCTDESW